MTDTAENRNFSADEMNLDDLEGTYAEAEAKESGDFDPVPDGKYHARVSKAWCRLSKQGKRMLSWELTIIGPTCAGRKVFRNNMIESPDNLKWLKGDLKTCGLILARLAELPARAADLADVHLEIQVKNRGKTEQGQDNVNVYLLKRIEMPEDGGAGVSGGGASTYDDNIPF